MLSKSGHERYLLVQSREGARHLDTLQQLRRLIVERFDPLPPGRALRSFLDYLNLAKSADRVGEQPPTHNAPFADNSVTPPLPSGPWPSRNMLSSTFAMKASPVTLA